MLRTCDICGTEFEAKRARICSSKCRMRKSRGTVLIKPGKVVALGNSALLPDDVEASAVEAATRRVLVELERMETPQGQAVLVLARKIDDGRDTGAGLAALVKQFDQTLRAATSGAHEDASPLDKARDELAARRDSRSA